MIKELIVVEGKNDAHAVRQALGDVDLIWTEGYGLTRDKLSYIGEAAKRQGVIVFTDPDSVGEQIRKRIQRHVPGVKHVYLSQAAARKNGDIGVENASPEEIRRVFAQVQVRQEKPESGEKITAADLYKAGLNGQCDSAERRNKLGRYLGIGDANAKQFLNRLQRFGIAREEFENGVKECFGGKCS